MPWNSGMMGGLDGGDGRLSRFHAIQEVALMIFGFVELDLVLIWGNLGKPIQVRGIESAAVHPDPTISANPFCAAADIIVAAGDDHGDVIGILQVDAVLGAGIPNRVRGGEITVAFDL